MAHPFLLCFNSMKVRLKPYGLYASRGYPKFQFHEGPIKTLMVRPMRLTLPRFNSMKVRLKPRLLLKCPVWKLRFNSMKVRLKLCVSRPLAYSQTCFNSMKVRLKR